MKYLVLIVVVVVAYLLWRNARLRDGRGAPPAAGGGAPGGPQAMVACTVCGLHLPRSEALEDAGGKLYCSKEHRLRAGD